MSRLLVTGADGFVGRHLVRAALAGGWEVVAAIVPGGADPAGWLPAEALAGVETVHADLRDPAAVARLARTECDAIVHLAAIASGAEARRDPALAAAVNRDGTAAFAAAVAGQDAVPRFLFVSTAEVYGGGHEEPIDESVPRAPLSPYAESKAAAEDALLARWGASGFPVVIARPFPHTGPGQDSRFVLPAFAERLRDARRSGATRIPVGNLDVVRDFVDVRDVVAAYLRLVVVREPGQCYNVATGHGRRLRDCLATLARMIGVTAIPVQDAALVRPADIPTLIGDPTRLALATGWTPQIPFDRTLQDLVDAQAD